MPPLSAQKPITLVGGYLGAGKTTFINRLLNSGCLPSQTAVLVNDFGDINIDEELIRSGSDNDQVIGLANGCVCCSIADDLTSVLDELKNSAIERVLLECSGVAEPHKARQQCHYPGFYPHTAVVLVDALNHTHRCADKYVGALAIAQVEQADLVVITKSSANPEFRLAELQPSIDADDADALEIVLGWRGEHAYSELAGPTSAPRFSTQTWRPRRPLPLARLQNFLDRLPDSVQRVKGFVETDAGVVEVQRVGTVTRLQPWASRPASLGLVFIGYVKEDFPAFDEEI